MAGKQASGNFAKTQPDNTGTPSVHDLSNQGGSGGLSPDPGIADSSSASPDNVSVSPSVQAEYANKVEASTTPVPYTVQTGLPQDEPVIIASQEILPISNFQILDANVINSFSAATTKNSADRDYALLMKETAVSITSKTAINFFVLNSSTILQAAQRIDSIKSFSDSTGSKLNALFVILSQAENALKLSNYKHQINTKETLGIYSNEYVDTISANSSPSLYGIGDYLLESGFDEKSVNGLSPTAAYQQFLLELKRTIITHSNKLRQDINFSSKDLPQRLKGNGYVVNGLFTIDRSKNKFGSLKNANAASFDGTETEINTYDYYFYKRFTLQRTQSKDLSVIASLKGQQLAGQILKQSQDGPYGLFTLSKSSHPELLAKEIYFSRAVKTSDIVKKLSELGYAVSTSAENFGVWDALIGQSFVSNVLTLPPDENSLLGLSRQIVTSPNDQDEGYRILTFETFDAPLEDPNIVLPTQGPLYYIDESLRISNDDRDNFDLSRLQTLIEKIEDSQKRLKALKCLYVARDVDATLLGINLTTKSIRDLTGLVNDDPIYQIVNKLSLLKDIYSALTQAAPNLGEFIPKVSTSYRASSLNGNFNQTKPGDSTSLSFQSKYMFASAIFNTGLSEFEANRPDILLTLFTIIMRGVYIKIVKEKLANIGFTVSYDAFKSAWRDIATYKRTVDIGGGGYDYAADFYKDAVPNGAFTIPSTGESKIVTVNGETIAADTLLDGRRGWSQILINQLGSNTPELLLDALLYKYAGQYQLSSKSLSPAERNKDTGNPFISYLLLSSHYNLGYSNIDQISEDYVDEVEYAKAFNSIINSQPNPGDLSKLLTPDEIQAYTALKTENEKANFVFDKFRGPKAGTNVLHPDRVTLGDDPVFRSLFLKGSSFVRQLGTGLDENLGKLDGLFKDVVDLMTNMFLTNIYQEFEPTGTLTKTAYGLHEKSDILFHYFLTICKVINSISFDSFAGFWTWDAKVPYASGTPGTESGNTSNTSYFRYGGYRIVSTPIKTIDLIKINSTIFSPRAKGLIDFLKKYNQEIMEVSNRIDLLEKFLNDSRNKIASFKQYLKSDFLSYLKELNTAVDGETSLPENERKNLVNFALSREQLSLSYTSCTEYVDRYLNKPFPSDSALKSFPYFADMKEGFSNYMPLSDLQSISYTILSPFFTVGSGYSDLTKIAAANEESGAANKRIISVGLPPRIAQFVMKDQSLDIDRSALIKIIVRRKDLINPGITLKPKDYYFDMRLFPTKTLVNWGHLIDDVINNVRYTPVDFLMIPMKKMGLNGRISAVTNFNQAYSNTDFNKKMWMNHVISLLCEEYVNYFTGLNINENNFYNYSSLSTTSKSIEKQFDNYLKTTEGKFDLTNLFGVNVPTGLSDLEQQNLLMSAEKSIKEFFRNETCFIGLDEVKRRILLPKKFDRVFHLLIDPDDFEIQSVGSQYVSKYLSNKVINKIGESNYKYSSNMTPKHVFADSYSVSIDRVNTLSLSDYDFIYYNN